jgi:hypothetical protein
LLFAYKQIVDLVPEGEDGNAITAIMDSNGSIDIDEIPKNTPKLSQQSEECGEMFMNAVRLMTTFRRVLYDESWSYAPPAISTTVPLLEANDTKAATSDNSAAASLAIPSPISSTTTHASFNFGLEALKLLSKNEIWTNLFVEKKLLEQLNPLAVVTGALPDWVRWLPKEAPFLLSLECRQKAMKFMGFGVSRAIVAMQEIKFPIAKKLEEVRVFVLLSGVINTSRYISYTLPLALSIVVHSSHIS